MNEETTEDENLKRIAVDMRRYYREKKTRQLGKPYLPHPRYEDWESWLKTAQIVQKLGANPLDYIEAQFKFSKASVMANTLYKQDAQKKWKRYMQYLAAKTKDDTLHLENVKAPRHVDLTERFILVWQDLDYFCGTHDLTTDAVLDTVLRMPLRFDPLTICLLRPTKKVFDVFCSGAVDELDRNPHLVAAAKELGYGISIDLLNEYRSANV